MGDALVLNFSLHVQNPSSAAQVPPCGAGTGDGVPEGYLDLLSTELGIVYAPQALDC